MHARKRHRRWVLAGACVPLALSTACVGRIGGDADTDQTAPDRDGVSISGLRRLTASEYYNTVIDLLGDDGLPVVELLPADARTPFDNDYGQQVASQGLIDAADYIAERAADRLLADPARRRKIVGCSPTWPADEPCLRTFVTAFGRRAFRRPLTEDEISTYVLGPDATGGPLSAAKSAQDFYIGVHDVIWSMLQAPDFLYRIETGVPVDGDPNVYRLTDYEVASRLSYFIWGSMPDDALLDRAAAGRLETPDDRDEAALELLQDARARKRIERFHSMWLGFDQLPYGGQLGIDVRTETSALIKRIVFDENLPWKNLFLFNQTFVTDSLADHYGLPRPDAPDGGWVTYDDGPGGIGRAGILSHGSFLSIGAKFNDTSPVKRGRAVRERLLCQDIAPPPPNVNVDAPVTYPDAVCKRDRFAEHRQGGCASCHNLMDPIGFGLERYDQFGVYRTYEPDNPDTTADESKCAIDGHGDVDGKPFSGPAQLGKLVVDSGVVTQCITTQLYRFVAGHAKLDTFDEHIVDLIRQHIGTTDFTFQDLVLEIVTHPSFGYRREE